MKDAVIDIFLMASRQYMANSLEGVISLCSVLYPNFFVPWRTIPLRTLRSNPSPTISIFLQNITRDYNVKYQLMGKLITYQWSRPPVGETDARRKGGFNTLMHTVSPDAFHNSNSRPDPPKCHENTRVVVINKIMDWVTGKIDTDTFICWLYGSAGAGKTAIARSVADFCTKKELLLASFLFFRPDAKRNTMAPLVANIAYCVTRVSSDARERIEAVIETDPLIFSYSVKEQFTKLVLEPLQLLEHKKQLFPKLVIIDGLDECLDKDAQTNLIRLLSSSTALPLKFLIVSRPEPHIKSAIFLASHRSKISRLQLNGDFAPEEDIRHFLTDKFREIKSCQPLNSRIPSFSPSEEQIDDLTRKASGQFIYASLAVRFINSNSDSPTRRLDIVLGIHPPTYPDHPFAELDALYIFILNSSNNPGLVRRILGVNAALDEIDSIQDTAAIEAVLGLKDGDVGIYLSSLGSVLEVEEDRAGEKIVFHHPFFMDFLRTAERAADYYVDDRVSHSLIAQWILQAFTSNGTCLQQLIQCCWVTMNKIFLVPTASRRAADPWLQRMDLISHLTHSLWTLDLERALEKFSFSAFLDAAIDSGTQKQSRDTLTKKFLDYLKDNVSLPAVKLRISVGLSR